MNQTEQVILLCGLAAMVLAVIFIVLIIKKRQDEKTKEYVLSTSARCQDLLKLNQEFSFWKLQKKYELRKTVNSKAQLNRFNFDAFLENCINDNLNEFNEIIRRAEVNRKLLERYQFKIENEIAELRDKTESKKISYRKYNKFEEKLANNLVQQPVITPEWFLYANYTSPKGRNFYENSRLYDLNEVMTHISIVQKRQMAKETSGYQRRMMTDSLRYDIMKRDGFHCVLCGRGAEDGVKLHVDHIVPVSKGGRTIPENLRTLCENCNLGKRDKYDANGVN